MKLAVHGRVLVVVGFAETCRQVQTLVEAAHTAYQDGYHTNHSPVHVSLCFPAAMALPHLQCSAQTLSFLACMNSGRRLSSHSAL